MSEPMTDARLVGIRQRQNRGIALSAADEHLQAYDDRASLLAEVVRLRAALEQERAANRQLVTECEAMDAQIASMREQMRPLRAIATFAQAALNDAETFGWHSDALIHISALLGQAFVAPYPTAGEE